MPRTTEITILSVFVFISSAATLSMDGLMAWFAIINYPNWTSPAGGVFGYYVMVASIVVFGLGVWGIAAGIGILNTRQWARISNLILGGIPLLISILGALIMFLDPGFGVIHLEDIVGSMRPEMMGMCGSLAAFGVFSLYFFNKESVKSKFEE